MRRSDMNRPDFHPAVLSIRDHRSLPAASTDPSHQLSPPGEWKSTWLWPAPLRSPIQNGRPSLVFWPNPAQLSTKDHCRQR
jgi:hypothetical protein